MKNLTGFVPTPTFAVKFLVTMLVVAFIVRTFFPNQWKSLFSFA